MKKDPAAGAIEALRSRGEFLTDGSRTWWLPYLPSADTPVDGYPPPLAVGSPEFLTALRQIAHVPAAPRPRRELVEALQDVAHSGRTVRVDTWSTREITAGGMSLAYCLNPAWVLRMTRTPSGHVQMTVERNGVGPVLYQPPSTFAPISFSDLEAAWPKGVGADGTGVVPGRLAAFERAIVREMPPPMDASAADHASQQCYVLAWWLGVWFGPLCRQGRPLLALVGAPGCGKTVTANLLGKAFYGRDFAVGGGVGGSRAVKDLTAYLVYRPVAVMDDQNDVPAESIDTLCKIATGAKIELAAMHKTLELESFVAQAAAALTSNRPAWALRDDLLERMLPVMISKPPPSTVLEDDRMDAVVRERVAIIAETLAAVSAALASVESWRTATRFQSWETWVRRAAKVGGWDTWLATALDLRLRQSVALACWADPGAHVLWTIADAMRHDPKYLTASEIYDTYMARYSGAISSDREHRPSAHALRSANTLGKFMAGIERSGSAAVTIVRGPLRNGCTTWTLIPKG